MRDSKSPIWFAIVNPNAGKGKGRADWERIQSILNKNDIPIISKFTSKQGDASILTIEAISNGHRNIISVGGDGTLNEIINGVMFQESCSTSEVTVSIIPVGTGNDWGRMFDIPLKYEGAVALIKQRKTYLHDVASLTYYLEEDKHTTYFINIAGTGFEATVIKKANCQKSRGRKNSKVLYLYNLVTSLLSYKNRLATITIDGRRFTQKIFSLNVGNGIYCGGGMRQTPLAEPNDGLLDVSVIKDISKLGVVLALGKLYDGTILEHPKIDGYRAKSILVECDSPMYSEADGESLGHTPLEFTIIPKAVKVVVG